MRRLTHIVCMSITLGIGFTPALTLAKEEPLVENQPNPDSEIAPHVTDPKIDAASKVPEIVNLLRQKVKYVFVIYQENRAFDQMFGTFPGAHGLFSQSESETPGFTQSLIDTDGKFIKIQPFRVGQAEDAWDLDDMGHSPPVPGAEDEHHQRQSINESICLGGRKPPLRGCGSNRDRKTVRRAHHGLH